MIPWFYLYRGDDVFILEVFIKVPSSFVSLRPRCQQTLIGLLNILGREISVKCHTQTFDFRYNLIETELRHHAHVVCSTHVMQWEKQCYYTELPA